MTQSNDTPTIPPEVLKVLMSRPQPITADELAALDRLLEVARNDSGQSRKVANFLLAWWNAGSCGGFDLTDLWGLDMNLRADAQTVFGVIARLGEYPTAYGRREAFTRLVQQWRSFDTE